MKVIFWVWLIVLVVVVGVVHHHHHYLHLDDFEEIGDGEPLFRGFEKALAEDRMTLMMKILDNRQAMFSWLRCQKCEMDHHHSLTKMGRKHVRKGRVGMGC